MHLDNQLWQYVNADSRSRKDRYTKGVVWLIPTSIGKRLGISAVKVNRLLKDMGLQISNHKPAKDEPSYLPTERSKEYSSMTAATGGNGAMTTYQHLKWSTRVLEPFKSRH